MDHCGREQRKPDPRENANIFSRLTFTYTGSLFRKAYKNEDLHEDDLYEVLKPCVSEYCGNKIEEKWLLQNKKGVPPSIYKLMWARFGWRFLLLGCTNLVWKIFNSTVEPWAFSRLIAYFKPQQTSVTRTDAYNYAALLLGLHLFQTFFNHNYFLWMTQLGIEMKIALSSLLYRKALKLTPSAISEISLGNIVTLITNDVNTFQRSIWKISEVWIGVVQTFIICYLLYARVGLVSFTGIGIVLSIIPLQLIMGKYVSVLRLATGKRTDERLQIMQEVLSTIRIIKMYNWQELFVNKINAARIKQLEKTYCDEDSDLDFPAASNDGEDDCACIFCNDLFCRSKPVEFWLGYMICPLWTHLSCADVPKKINQFVYEIMFLIFSILNIYVILSVLYGQNEFLQRL